MRSKPTRRATSSTRSISRSRSGRKVGTSATSASPVGAVGRVGVELDAERRQRVPHVLGVEVGAEHRVHPARAHGGCACRVDRGRVHVARVGRDLRAAPPRRAAPSPVRRSRATASGSMPRSKRALDSLRSFSRFDDSGDAHRARSRPTRAGSRWWRRTPPTSTPPMIPAMACGARSASQISRSSSVSARSTPSRVVIVSPVVGEPHDDAAPGEAGEVERVQRLVALEQHVVGDVDDVADRPHARLHAGAAPSTRATAPS